jgi:fibronectin type 3 domain-containing protein
LSGSGTAPAPHTVNLSWTPSSTQSVVAYNVYRSGVSGGPYAQLTSADPSASYSDATVSAGQTYYYVVTSVDGTGAESAYSNQARAVIPTP